MGRIKKSQLYIGSPSNLEDKDVRQLIRHDRAHIQSRQATAALVLTLIAIAGFSVWSLLYGINLPDESKQRYMIIWLVVTAVPLAVSLLVLLFSRFACHRHRGKEMNLIPVAAKILAEHEIAPEDTNRLFGVMKGSAPDSPWIPSGKETVRVRQLLKFFNIPLPSSRGGNIMIVAMTVVFAVVLVVFFLTVR